MRTSPPFSKKVIRVIDLALPQFTRLCEKYIGDGKAESYAKGLLGLSRWMKITVTPKRLASFDYTKDKAYKTATGEQLTLKDLTKRHMAHEA